MVIRKERRHYTIILEINALNIHWIELLQKISLQNISIIALIISILPFATLIPAFLQIILPDGIRTVWSGINIACVITGLCLSIICVKNNESRSLINIISTIISGLLLLLVSGIIVLALFLTFLQ